MSLDCGHYLRTAFNKQQGEINSLRETVDSNCAAITSSTDRSAGRDTDIGHRMFSSSDGRQMQNVSSSVSKRCNLVVEGIPDLPIPEIYAYFITLADCLGAIVYKSDIMSIPHKASPVAGKPRPGPIVITFTQPRLRDMILRKKTDLKGIDKYSFIFMNPLRQGDRRLTLAVLPTWPVRTG